MRCSQLARTSHFPPLGSSSLLYDTCLLSLSLPFNQFVEGFFASLFCQFFHFLTPIQPSFVFCIFVWENLFSVCIDGEILRYAATGSRSSHLTYFFLLLFLTHSWTQLLKVPPIKKTRSGLQRLVIFSSTLIWCPTDNYQIFFEIFRMLNNSGI